MSKVKDCTSIYDLLYTLTSLQFAEFDTSCNLSGYNLCASVGVTHEGLYYPRGGYTKLRQSLISAIRRGGGSVYKDVKLKCINVTPNVGTRNKPSVGGIATGVQCYVSNLHGLLNDVITLKSSIRIISGMGHLYTYFNMLHKCDTVSSPNTLTQEDAQVQQKGNFKQTSDGKIGFAAYADLVSLATKAIHCSLAEASPIVQVVFWVKGSVEDLSIYSCEYMESVAQQYDGKSNEMLVDDKEVAKKKRNEVCKSMLRIWSPTAKECNSVLTSKGCGNSGLER